MDNYSNKDVVISIGDVLILSKLPIIAVLILEVSLNTVSQSSITDAAIVFLLCNRNLSIILWIPVLT